MLLSDMFWTDSAGDVPLTAHLTVPGNYRCHFSYSAQQCQQHFQAQEGATPRHLWGLPWNRKQALILGKYQYPLVWGCRMKMNALKMLLKKIKNKNL